MTYNVYTPPARCMCMRMMYAYIVCIKWIIEELPLLKILETSLNTKKMCDDVTEEPPPVPLLCLLDRSKSGKGRRKKLYFS